jgi:hypothetical protein
MTVMPLGTVAAERRAVLSASRTARRGHHERDYTESLGNVITIDDERINLWSLDLNPGVEAGR